MVGWLHPLIFMRVGAFEIHKCSVLDGELVAPTHFKRVDVFEMHKYGVRDGGLSAHTRIQRYPSTYAPSLPP